MKKHYLLAAAIATLLATGCQKEQELVTLGAVISQPGKTYIDNRYPCWNEGDEVYVNNAAYTVSAISGSSAQIAEVVGDDNYRAIFPASLVAPGSNITNSATIPVTLPATQRYQVVDGHQRVDAPMGAYTDGGTLQFYNLCSIVHVVVNNNTGSTMTLRSLKMETANAMLSGYGTATVNGTSDDGITLTSDASHAVSLRLSGATNVTLAAGAQSAYDIYVPSFSTDNVTLTLTTTDGYYYELTKPSVALRHNTYTTVTLNVDQLTQILAAELVSGPTFNRAIPENATAVVFEYNSAVSSGTLLSTIDSPVPIYGNLDGTTWRVSTSASMIKANSSCYSMFDGHYYHPPYRRESPIQEIDFGEGFNTSNVTDMRYMFIWCKNLTNIDLSDFNTANVTTMDGMFVGCSSLENLNISNFNTENVAGQGSENYAGMNTMFSGCTNLTNLDLSNFNTANVTGMSNMFQGCSSLSSLDLSSFNTENVTNMSSMFSGCSSLTSLDLSNFNTENVTNMSRMFINCRSLTSLDISNFNTGNVEDMGEMFLNCRSLTTLNLSNFNTENVTNMNKMFERCICLTSLDLSNFNTENVTYMSFMFDSCINLTSLDVSHFNTENVTNMDWMFYACNSLTSLDLSNFNTENVTTMRQMFEYCSNLTNLNVSHFSTENVASMHRMFDGCVSLSSLDISSFSTENVTDMEGMFSGCSSLTSLDLSVFNTDNVATMRAMFGACNSLISLDLSNFNTANVTDMMMMFDNCSSLTNLDLSNSNTENVTSMDHMLSGCSSLTSLNLSNFDMSSVTNKYNMCNMLAYTSGHCTIICPSAVQTELENGTGLPTSRVTFTWVRPTSK